MSPSKRNGAQWRKEAEAKYKLPAGTLKKMNLKEALAQGLAESPDGAGNIISDEVRPVDESTEEEIQVESQGPQDESGFGSLLKRAGQNLKNTLTESDVPVKKTSKRVTPSTREDFSLLVVSIVTLLVTFAKVDDRVKPINSEIEQFSNHLSGILLRHLPINSKLSADALDIIGIFAVASGWYARVSIIERIEQPQQKQIKSGANGDGHYVSPIADISPGTEDALNRVKAQAATRQ